MIWKKILGTGVHCLSDIRGDGMSDWIIIPDYKVEDKPDQPIGVLAPNGKPIVRLPTPVGFTASQAKIYAVKS